MKLLRTENPSFSRINRFRHSKHNTFFKIFFLRTSSAHPLLHQRNILLPVNSVFYPTWRRYRPIRSTYTSTAAIMFFKNSEFGDYPPLAGAYVTEWGTLGSSTNYHRNEPQTFLRPQLLSLTFPLSYRRRN